MRTPPTSVKTLAARRSQRKASSTRRTFAAIDMGSSSAKMLILRQGDGGRWKTVVDVKQGTSLGRDIGPDKILPRANEDRALAALKTFVAQAQKYGVAAQDIGMIATAVMRNTVNGPAFARQIQDELGVTPHVLAGTTEAELGYLGAIEPFRKKGPAQRFASLDLGGGSFQLALGDGHRMQAGASTQVGSNFVIETYFPTEKISGTQFDAADAGLKQTAPLPLDTKRLAGRTLVATGGISKFLRAHFHKDVITRADIDALRRQIGKLNGTERIAVIQQNKNAKTLDALGVATVEGAREYGTKLPASSTLLLRILDGLGVAEVRVSQTDSRHAIIRRLQAGIAIDA
jgi:exopolyphosphatase/pppGpp-phosphohydrolase